MSSPRPLGWTPDVFVSFEEDDKVSCGFKSSLCKELQQKGIGFRDTQDYGDEAIPQAMILQARFALVLLSKKYTHSSKCLEELVEFLNRRGESEYLSLVVIPIFYRIDPSTDLQIGGELVRESNEDKKQRWCSALAQVGGIPGYELRAHASQSDARELIGTIIERLVNEMQSLYSYKVFGPFGGEGKIYWHFGEINGIEALYRDFIASITFRVSRRTPNEVDPGRNDGVTPFKVQLKSREGEHITHFRGRFKNANGGGSPDEMEIASLTFKTNQRPLGTINREGEEHFSVPTEAGKIIEIFGGKTRGSGRPTSIGARVELTRPDPPPEDSHPVGLFGSRKGSKWEHRDEHTNVRRIKVALDSTRHKWVPWIAFLNDGSAQSDEEEEEFIISDRHEYLSSISGSLNTDGITSLTFLTNKKRTKTIGAANGTHFSSPLTGGKIVGFYGWSDDTHLHGIGAYFKPTPTLTPYLNQVTSIGPFGGARAWDDGIHTGVKKIYLLIDGDIRYIRFVYEDDGEEFCVTQPKGISLQEDAEEEVPFKYPYEYLTSIVGYTRHDGSIQALTFYTNIKRYDHQSDDFSDPKKYFWYPLTGTNKIVGFHGTWGKTLNSIGAYVKPISPRPSPVPSGPLPVGSRDFWDDEEHSHVIGYRVTANGDPKRIESITFMYEDNGSLVEGSRHGGGEPSSGEWVMLNLPEERLTSLVGHRCRERDGLLPSTTYDYIPRE